MKTLYQATALFLLALCFCQPTLAQTPDTAKVYRHQIGILASPLYENENFRSKMPVALGLIYRANYKENKALRVAVAAAYERNTFLTTLEEHPFPKDTVDKVTYIEMNVGHEWTFPITRRISLGYGTDITGFYTNKLVSVDNILFGENGPIAEKVSRETSIKGIALQPFLNLNFALTKRITLVAESKFRLSYSKLRWNATGRWGLLEADPEERLFISGSYEKSSFNSIYAPLSSLQLNFKF